MTIRRKSESSLIELEFKKEALKEFKRENRRKEKSMELDTRDRDRKHLIKASLAIFFFVTAVLKYTNNIPIPTEIVFGIPASTILSMEVPKNILGIFKKPPP